MNWETMYDSCDENDYKDSCDQCEEKDDLVSNLRDQVQGIVEAAYKTGDVHSLEACLDEICSYLDIKLIPAPMMAIAKRSDERAKERHWHLGYQRAIIDIMHGRNK